MNDLSRLRRRRESLPGARGRPSVIQGRYGSRGNLELTFADPENGLWVCWFNADRPGRPPEAGAVPGGWSGGLRFAAGRRYDEVAAVQARRGPDFLELVARSGERLEQLTWTPHSGFRSRGDLPGDGASDVVIGETAEGLVVAGVRHGVVRRWSATASTAERPHWEQDTAFRLPTGWERAALRVEPDGQVVALVAVAGRLVLCRQDPPVCTDLSLTDHDVHARALALGHGSATPIVVAATPTGLLTVGGTSTSAVPLDVADVTACRSMIDRDRVEVVGRIEDRLAHVRLTVDGSGAVEHEATHIIVSDVHWPESSPVHRR